GAGAVVPCGNNSLERLVLKRMVFDHDGQALVLGIERGPFRDRPTFQDAVEFEAEVVVHPSGAVFLDHEVECGLLWPALTARLRGLPELALSSVLFKRHDRSTPGTVPPASVPRPHLHV